MGTSYLIKIVEHGKVKVAHHAHQSFSSMEDCLPSLYAFCIEARNLNAVRAGLNHLKLLDSTEEAKLVKKTPFKNNPKAYQLDERELNKTHPLCESCEGWIFLERLADIQNTAYIRDDSALESSIIPPDFSFQIDFDKRCVSVYSIGYDGRFDTTFDRLFEIHRLKSIGHVQTGKKLAEDAIDYLVDTWSDIWAANNSYLYEDDCLTQTMVAFKALIDQAGDNIENIKPLAQLLKETHAAKTA